MHKTPYPMTSYNVLRLGEHGEHDAELLRFDVHSQFAGKLIGEARYET